MTDDKMEFEILADGTIKVTTDGISQANHVGADKLLLLVQELAGAPPTIIKRKKGETHGHVRSHEHN